MTPLDIWNKVASRLAEGVMMHAQFADYFDFLNEHGYKRYQEFRFLDESTEMRGVHRYVLNHHHRLVNDADVSRVAVIPASWLNYSRFDVTTADRKNATLNAWNALKSWETATKAIYEEAFTQFSQNGNAADTTKMATLVRCVDDELKCIDRHLLELLAVDCSSEYVMLIQKEWHEKYDCKLKSIGIEIC